MKKILSFCLVLVTSFALVACGNGVSSDPETELTTNEVTEKAVDDLTENGEINLKHVGILLPTLQSAWFVNNEASIREVLEKEGITVTTASSDRSAARELEILENFKQMDVDGVIAFVSSGSDVDDTLVSLRKEGIRVVTFVVAVGEGYDVQILTDPNQVGEEMAKMAAEWVDTTFPDAGPGSIEVGLLLIREDENSSKQSNSMMKIAEFTDKVKIVVEYESTYADGEVRILENTEMMLAAYPDISVIMTVEHSLAADEVVMSTPGIDLAHFGIFSDAMMPELAVRIRESVDNKSVIRGVTMVGGIGGSFSHVANAMLGDLEVPKDGIYWNPIYGVTAENIDELYPAD